jgi:hypothetical protein
VGAFAVDVGTADADANPKSDTDTERDANRDGFRQRECFREFDRFADSYRFAEWERLAEYDSASSGAPIREAETGSFAASEADPDSGRRAKSHSGQNAVPHRNADGGPNCEFQRIAGERRSRGAWRNRRADREPKANRIRHPDGGDCASYRNIDSGDANTAADPSAVGDTGPEPGRHTDPNSKFDADADRGPAHGSNTESDGTEFDGIESDRTDRGSVRSDCGKPDSGRCDVFGAGRGPDRESAAKRVSLPVRVLDSTGRQLDFCGYFKTSTETSPRRSIKSIDAPDAERLTISHTAPSPTLRLSIFSQSSQSGITGASSTIFRSKPRI